MLFDTHTHLNDAKFAEDQAEVIVRARENGVSYMVNIGYNRETIPTSIELAEKYEFIYTAIGWHPHDASTFRDEDLTWIKELCKHPKVVAIGEIGLDYYWDNSPRDVQKEVFRKQIGLARELGLPIVIHARDAYDDVVQILKEEKADEVGGIMHCFGGDLEIMQKCLELNFYIGLGGPVTFKNAKLPKEVAKSVPLDRLVLETDSPYLAPHPYRGKRNESAYVRLVAEEIARLREMPFEELAQITTNNAKRIYRIS
jgi:TatD DNase family protein